MTEADLLRFVNAQSDVHDEVTKEITEGRKQTHWMWFVFPPLEGLGHSSMAQRYAIRDLDQARRWTSMAQRASSACSGSSFGSRIPLAAGSVRDHSDCQLSTHKRISFIR